MHLAVFYETVRLWPGLPKNGRMALCDDVLPALPEHGLPAVKIEKGDIIFWSDYHMMRSEAVGRFCVAVARLMYPSAGVGSLGQLIRPE